MPANIKNKVIILGDNVGTGQICSGDKGVFDRSRLTDGVVIAAGDQFGQGDHAADAVAVLKGAGVSCIIARTVARKFYRAAINGGLPVVVTDRPDKIQDGVEIEIDFQRNEISCAGTAHKIPPFPGIIQRILDLGGLLPYVRNEISKKQSSP